MAGLLIGLVGDVLVDRDDPSRPFAGTASALRDLDIRFGNCEAPYTEAPHLAPTAGAALTPHPSNLQGLKAAGFDVMSLANNHVVDAGHEAMLETADRLRDLGIAVCGAGRDLAEARRPAIVRSGGVSVGFLAYASVFPFGYEAREGWPGVAPLRAYNHLVEAYPNYWIPGTPGTVVTVPHEQDHAALVTDIAALRDEVDVVVVSVHWGDYLRPFVLTDHERRAARICIDSGADVVVGAHHHIVRGMEWYKGRPILYGLGHFVFDVRSVKWPAWLTAAWGSADEESYSLGPREGWPLLPMHRDARMTMLAFVDVEADGIESAGFLPCRLNPEGEVEPLDPASPGGRGIIDYVRRACTSQGLATELETDASLALGGLPTVRFRAQ